MPSRGLRNTYRAAVQPNHPRLITQMGVRKVYTGKERRGRWPHAETRTFVLEAFVSEPFDCSNPQKKRVLFG
jgi:hypothetical protein